MLSAQLPSGETSVPPLRIIHLTKWYGEERAIDGVTFSASAGQIAVTRSVRAGLGFNFDFGRQA
jgi:hypothetical protein